MGGFAVKFKPGEVTPIKVEGAMITHDNPESKQLPARRANFLVQSRPASKVLVQGNSPTACCPRSLHCQQLLRLLRVLQNVISRCLDCPDPDFTLTLPLPVRRRLVHLFKTSGGLSTELLRQSVSSEVGEVYWRPDEKNEAVVKETIRSLQGEYSKDSWEVSMFLAGHYSSRVCDLRRLQGDVSALDAHQLLLAQEMGITDKLRSLDVKDLNDCNKGDAVVRLVAPVQII